MLSSLAPGSSASFARALVPFSSLHDVPTSNVPREVLAHCPASAVGLPISVIPIPSDAELHDYVHPCARIFVAQQGFGRRWYSRGGKTRHLRTAPRMIEMYERGLA